LLPLSDPDRPARRIEVVSPLTAIVFSVVCWLVFSVLHADSSPENLPEMTRRFLHVQRWWLAAGVLGVGLGLFAGLQVATPHWKRIARIYALVLSVFSVFNIAWGIIAIYLVTLPSGAP
jgi:uncharacterized membrane protein